MVDLRPRGHGQVALAPLSEWIAATRRGDDAAAEALFASLRASLDRFLSGRLPRGVQSIWQTDDLVQEVCARAWKGFAEFDQDSPAALWGYLRTIARNLTIDICRGELLRRSSLYATPPYLTPEDRNGQDISDVLARQELYERALELLDERVRAALLLRLEVGASYDDVASALGVPSAEAARKTLRRALDQVLRRMEHSAGDRH